MNIEKLKREIEHQTRNGRKNIYIKVDDLNELVQGAKQEVRGEERIYIGIEAMKKIVEAYEKNTIKENEKAVNDFKERLKVDMPDYKLTRIDEYGFKFEPIEKEREYK